MRLKLLVHEEAGQLAHHVVSKAIPKNRRTGTGRCLGTDMGTGSTAGCCGYWQHSRRSTPFSALEILVERAVATGTQAHRNICTYACMYTCAYRQISRTHMHAPSCKCIGTCMLLAVR